MAQSNCDNYSLVATVLGLVVLLALWHFGAKPQLQQHSHSTPSAINFPPREPGCWAFVDSCPKHPRFANAWYPGHAANAEDCAVLALRQWEGYCNTSGIAIRFVPREFWGNTTQRVPQESSDEKRSDTASALPRREGRVTPAPPPSPPARPVCRQSTENEVRPSSTKVDNFPRADHPRCDTEKFRRANKFYISIVVATRNDFHGHSWAYERVQHQIWNVAALATCYRLPVEHIVVDWNPPSENRPLAEVLNYTQSEHYTLRVITVPREYHVRAYQDRHSWVRGQPPPELNMLEYHAKNVGIRRARGTFILICNGDNLFTAPFFRYLASYPLCDVCSYAAVRFDFDEHFSWHRAPHVGCGDSWQHVATDHMKGMGCGITSGYLQPTWTEEPLHYNYYMDVNPAWPWTCAGGDFSMAHRDTMFALAGIPEMIWRGSYDGFFASALAAFNKNQMIYSSPVVLHQWHRQSPYHDVPFVHSASWEWGRDRKGPSVQPDWGLRGVDLPESPGIPMELQCP